MDAHALTRFLFSLVILVVTAHFFGHWFERFKLPRVIGEISAGIVLGPSLLGALSWRSYDLFLFDEFVGHKVLLNAFYWLGLCLLMFTSGFHIQRRLPGGERRDIGLLVLATSTVPFALGWWAVSFLPVDQYMQYTANLLAFKIVFAVSVTVTSIPVISKIFMDLGLMPTKFAKVVIATATLHDIVLWTAIAVATTVQRSGEVHVGELVRAVVICLVFIAFFLLLGDRIIQLITRLAPQFAHVYPVAYLLIVCLALASLASYIDAGAVFGAIIAGMLFGTLPQREFQEARATIASFAMSFFVPIYFAMVGLQISFQGNLDPLFTLEYLALSTTLVVVTVWPTMRIAGHSAMAAWNFCVAMTTRGGPAIVLASLAYSLGIVNVRFFVTLILTSLITDVICGVWFRFVIDRRLELYEGAPPPPRTDAGSDDARPAPPREAVVHP
jgi:Kef-type K+ transport system membrane component KefB